MLHCQDWIWGASWEGKGGKKRLSWTWESLLEMKCKNQSSKTWTWAETTASRSIPGRLCQTGGSCFSCFLTATAWSGHRQRTWFTEGTPSISLPPPLGAGGQGSQECFQPCFSWRGMQPHVVKLCSQRCSSRPCARSRRTWPGQPRWGAPLANPPGCSGHAPPGLCRSHHPRSLLAQSTDTRFLLQPISVPPAGPSVTTSSVCFRSQHRGAGQRNLTSPARPLPPPQQSLQENVAFPLERQLPVSRSLDLCIPYTFEIVELIAGSCWNIAHRIPLPFFLIPLCLELLEPHPRPVKAGGKPPVGWLQWALEQADAEVAFLLLACQNIHALLPSYSDKNKDVYGSEIVY